ncbi:hypothetical protein CRENBAI_005596 [Crenichthys baileyi]|uniref:Uncharacterized protein n=1 Tax=Crenichthys baileyi TaxID=28760 RepID=A0AAV9S8P9_9TELE
MEKLWTNGSICIPTLTDGKKRIFYYRRIIREFDLLNLQRLPGASESGDLDRVSMIREPRLHRDHLTLPQQSIRHAESPFMAAFMVGY